MMIAFLPLFTGSTFAQKIHLKKVVRESSITFVNLEEYYLIRRHNGHPEHKGLLHGTYKGFYHDGSLRMIGKYRYGEKDGVWEYYNLDHGLVEKYDHTTNEILYFKYILADDAGVKILADDGYYADSIHAHFIGGDEAYYAFIDYAQQYPDYALKNKIEGSVTLSFYVLSSGMISDIEVISSDHESLTNEAMNVCELMPAWAPEMINGDRVESKQEITLHWMLYKK